MRSCGKTAAAEAHQYSIGLRSNSEREPGQPFTCVKGAKMFLKYKLVSSLPIPKLRKLEWHRTMIDRDFALRIESAQRKKKTDEVERLCQTHWFELDMNSEEVDGITTNRLLSEARSLQVPVPGIRDDDGTDSKYWYTGRYYRGRYLTNEGIVRVRTAIREERNARHEERTRWMPWLTVLTGLVGALTGLLAVWKNL